MAASNLGRKYEDGEIIIQQGESGDSMYVVLDGLVEVLVSQESEIVRLTVLGEGEFFGEMGLFEHRPRSATVRAVGQAHILTVDKKTMLRKIKQDPSLALRLLERMSSRIREMHQEFLAERIVRSAAIL
jgi:CRP-like cAMP-binding protein